MKKILLAAVILMASAFASAQTTNGPASCQSTGNVPYYCVGAQVFVNGAFDGYISFYFHYTNGMITSGNVYRLNTDGSSRYTSTDLAGSFDGTTMNVTFTGGNAVENFGTRLGKCYKGHCSQVPYIVDGSGSY